MCYDVSYMTQKAEKYAQHHGEEVDWADLLKRVPPTFHASGFDQPELPAITAEHNRITTLSWPFIPPTSAPTMPDGRPINTLNARDDKIFSPKSVYYESANERRCAVVLDGFFDHHHKRGIAFPHFVRFKSGEPLFVAGLWQPFKNTLEEKDCVTLVTTRANKEMAWIHNEPAYSPESRMIFVLQGREAMETWIHGSADEAKELIAPLPDDVLEYFPCKPVKSNKKLKRTYLGNVPEIQERAYYPELEEEQGSLF